MHIMLFNSRSGKIAPLLHDPSTPIHIYTCGPTVYDEVHLGNLKTFMWSDFIVGVLKAFGFITKYIMNITDIDDKIIHRLPEKTKEALHDYTSFYTAKFLNAMSRLGIQHYDVNNIHRVTDHVDHISAKIKELHDTGHTYVTSDGSVYYDVETFRGANPFAPNAANSSVGYTAQRAIIRADDVRSPRDFALWKAKPEEDPEIQWELSSIAGAKPGRMGWHIECSALADRLLGKVHVKIGGSDLKHVHHASEIYQSESLHPSEQFGDYWIHTGFLNFSGEKMSKSIGNVLRLHDVEDRINLRLLRLYLLSKSYRHDFDYNEYELSDGSYLRKSFINLHLLYNKVSRNCYRSTGVHIPLDTTIYERILHALSYDFDANNALGLLFEYVSNVSKLFLTESMAQNVLNNLNKINQLFNIIDYDLIYISPDIDAMLEQRDTYRKAKQYEMADTIRQAIQEKYIIEDDRTGVTLMKRF